MYMRLALLLLALAVAAPSAAQAQAKCPSDATRASEAVWASGLIPAGETKSGRHPCGKEITCTRGRGSSGRRCRWN